MDMLEHFEDNLNTNITNKRNLANFLKVARTVRKNLNNPNTELMCSKTQLRRILMRRKRTIGLIQPLIMSPSLSENHEHLTTFWHI